MTGRTWTLLILSVLLTLLAIVLLPFHFHASLAAALLAAVSTALTVPTLVGNDQLFDKDTEQP